MNIPCPPHDYVLHWRLVTSTRFYKKYETWAVCAECRDVAMHRWQGRGGGIVGGIPCCLKWPHGGIRDDLREHEYDLVAEEAYA